MNKTIGPVGPGNANLATMPESGSYAMADINWNGEDIWYVRDGKDQYCNGKGAKIDAGGTDGYILVHLIGDPEGETYQLDMEAGKKNDAIFDAMYRNGNSAIEAETTILL